MAVTRTAGLDLAGLVLPLAKALTALESSVARRHGMTSWQCAVLRAAAEPPGRTQHEIVGAIGYDRNRIVADLDDLERRALLFRRVDDRDRRSNRIEVTAAGRRLARAATRDLRDGADDLLAAVAPGDERDAMLRGLTALRERCVDDAWCTVWLGRP